jgi:hypothetical protein
MTTSCCYNCEQFQYSSEKMHTVQKISVLHHFIVSLGFEPNKRLNSLCIKKFQSQDILKLKFYDFMPQIIKCRGH